MSEARLILAILPYAINDVKISYNTYKKGIARAKKISRLNKLNKKRMNQKQYREWKKKISNKYINLQVKDIYKGRIKSSKALFTKNEIKNSKKVNSRNLLRGI